MRRLILTRGHQGSGKTRFLWAQGLGGYRLSADDIRQVLGSPTLSATGRVGANHDHEARVWALLYETLAERMSRGELVCVDATHRAAGDFDRYLELAKTWGYRVACVDFTAVPLAEALAANAGRDGYAVVPEAVVRKTHAACLEGSVPTSGVVPVEHIEWTPDDPCGAALRAWLRVPTRDLSDYAAVVHVGDLQGCYAPLADYLRGGLRTDAFYVFVGDLCDRGPENDAVVRFALEAPENVAFLWGNHDRHLHRWAQGLPPLSDEFDLRTRPQLEAAGIGPEDAATLCDRLLEVLPYRWGEQRVLCTHAGLATVPEHLERVSLRQLTHGTGRYTDPVDRRFSELAPAGWTQIHGHRNPLGMPTRAGARSYNLEGQVEHGGQLRIVELDARGFTAVEVPNRVFKPLAQRVADGTAPSARALPDWLGDAPQVSADQLAALRDHPLVRERQSTSRPHLVSFNFTRDAFYDRAWDDLNVRARGLFVHADTGEVAARAYEKFFNLDERPETTLDGLERHLEFPVDAYVKDNGYLGILGYDRTRDDLLFCSKASPDTDFAHRFADLARQLWPPAAAERIRRYLRDTHSAMAFEVIDPVGDPHIIEYDAPRLVLLDVIHRGLDFARLPYERLKRLGRALDIDLKQHGLRLRDFAALTGWLEAARAPGYRFGGAFVEGFVLEDQRGFLTKVKLDHYAFWKQMRSLKQRVLKVRGTNAPLRRNLDDPRAQAFHAWCLEQSDEVLERDIIALRRLYAS